MIRRNGTSPALFLAACLLAGCGPERAPAGPPVTRPVIDGDRLTVRDGTSLPLSIWTPGDDAASNVLALHSFGDFRLAFEGLGPELAAHGHRVLAIDQRGFGETHPFGIWPTGDTLVSDLRDLLAATRARWPEVPVHLLGESMGGSVVINAAAAGDLDGVESLILAAPGVREGIPFRYGWNALLFATSLVAPWLSLHNDQAKPPLSDVANARLGEDPRILRDIRVDTYYGLLRFADAASAHAGALRRPTLLIYGTADDFVIPASICALLRDAPGPVEPRIVEGGVHRILHQAGVDQPKADIRAWLDGRRNLEPAVDTLMPVDRVCDEIDRSSPGTS
ncbi:MAG: alpha/beta fold hydrolase [Geminicoccaceae bacterium]|nr:alpha/beta fold hydrolase [Geminicoccaceae bacterium]